MSDDAFDADNDDGQIALKPSSEDSSWSPKTKMGEWSSSVTASAASEVESETSFQGGERIRNNGSSAAAPASATASIGSNSKPGSTDDESHSTSVSNWSSSNATTTKTPTFPAFKKGQNVFVAIGKADHVAIFDSFIHDETTNRPLLAKVKYSSTLKWDRVFVDQLKPMHFEKNGELITAPYSKRSRQETNRYQPLPGGGTATAAESKSSIAASTRGIASTTNSSSRMGSGRNRKLVHDEKDETLGSKRTRQVTTRYQPLMGGRTATSAEAKSNDGDARGGMSPPWKDFFKRSRRETSRYTPMTGGGASSTKREVARPSAAFAAATPNLQTTADKSNEGKKGRGSERNGKKSRLKAKSLSGDNEKGDVVDDDVDFINDNDVGDEDVIDDAPVHGYYQVDEILDRRMKKVGSDLNGVGMRYIVEYFVSWKKPRKLNLVDASDYEPCWLVAENLDQHSLAEAFRMFPTDADPDYVEATQHQQDGVQEGGQSDIENDSSDAESDEESDDDDAEEIEDDASSFEGDIQEYDNVEDDDGESKVPPNAAVDPSISHLEDSDYDAPGTVELVIKSKIYRVGQSYVGGLDGSLIYTISVIHPNTRKAKCRSYMHLKDSFACPKGHEYSYVLLGEEVTLDLAALKTPYKVAFTKFSMKYDQDGDDQRTFAYYNDTGKIQYHPTGRPTVLDLFAGAGGMSLGMEKYFNVKWVVDNNEIACSTLNSNKKNSNVLVYTEDVRKFILRSMKGNPCYPSVGEVDHIHASPPCKGFSRANRTGGKNDNLNNSQTLLFVKAIKHFRPKTATFENVPGLVLDDYKGYLQSVISGLLKLSYQVRVQILNSSCYGDPQNRRRLIIMAARSDCRLPNMPPPTHGHGPGLLPIKTCKDAIQMFENLDPSKSGTALIDTEVIFNHIAPWPKSAKKETDYELMEDEPSRTVLARQRPHLHYNGMRFISVREAACLQSFPINYRFYGSLAQQYSQVGNAVPVKLATAIARSVAIVHGCAV